MTDPDVILTLKKSDIVGLLSLIDSHGSFITKKAASTGDFSGSYPDILITIYLQLRIEDATGISRNSMKDKPAEVDSLDTHFATNVFAARERIKETINRA